LPRYCNTARNVIDISYAFCCFVCLFLFFYDITQVRPYLHYSCKYIFFFLFFFLIFKLSVDVRSLPVYCTWKVLLLFLIFRHKITCACYLFTTCSFAIVASMQYYTVYTYELCVFSFTWWTNFVLVLALGWDVSQWMGGSSRFFFLIFIVGVMVLFYNDLTK
jgi:hypothetical protein